jgi:hypothetical protein
MRTSGSSRRRAAAACVVVGSAVAVAGATDLPIRPKTQASVAAISDDRALRSLKALQLQAQVTARNSSSCCTSHVARHTSHVISQGLNTSSSSSSGYGYSQQQHSSSSAWASGGGGKLQAPSIKDRSAPLGHHSTNTSDLYAATSRFKFAFRDTLRMYGDSTSRSKNSLPGTSHGKTSSSHGTGSGTPRTCFSAFL